MSTAMTFETKKTIHVKQMLCMVMCCVLILSVFMLGTASVAMCTGSNATTSAATAIEDGINEMANQIYKTMRSIITPITIIGFAWAGFQFLLGGAQGTEKARKILMGSAIGLALVVFAPLFGQAVATWFASSGTGDLSDYNPL